MPADRGAARGMPTVLPMLAAVELACLAEFLSGHVSFGMPGPAPAPFGPRLRRPRLGRLRGRLQLLCRRLGTEAQ